MPAAVATAAVTTAASTRSAVAPVMAASIAGATVIVTAAVERPSIIAATAVFASREGEEEKQPQEDISHGFLHAQLSFAGNLGSRRAGRSLRNAAPVNALLRCRIRI
jgi:hypothetical protein